MSIPKTLVGVCLAIFLSLPLSADDILSDQVTIQIDQKRQGKIIKSICRALSEEYLDPKIASDICTFLENKLADGGYDTHISAADFAASLTADLQRLSNDRHLRVTFNQDRRTRITSQGRIEEAQRQRRERERYINYGFHKMERLAGNIGYIKIVEFAKERAGWQTAGAVMSFLSNSDAIIIDLRNNNGGSPRMVQRVLSYFFDETPRHLINHSFRDVADLQEFWTLSELPGKRLTETPLYVLTNQLTFSAAEEFVYCLKRFSRATIVGETTGGGAHIGSHDLIDAHFGIFIPYGKVSDPLTGENWEGKGISPDVAATSEAALNTAHQLALENLLSGNSSQFDENRRWALEALDSEIPLEMMDSTLLSMLPGEYQQHNVVFDNGRLYFQPRGAARFEMIPVKNNQFFLRDIESVKLQFRQDQAKDGVEMINLNVNGRIERFWKQ